MAANGISTRFVLAGPAGQQDAFQPGGMGTSSVSLVAVEKEITRTEADALKTTAVPNAVAAGQVQQPGTYPQSATWMPFNIAFGTLSLLFWIIIQSKNWRRKIGWRQARRA